MTESPVDNVRVLLVIPTYNNRPTLRNIVEKALKTRMPVLVVSDGSTDGGIHTLTGLRIDLLELPSHRGKGAAIRAGAEWAEKNGYTHIITLDADGQHDPKEAVRFLAKIRENPMSIVVGARDFSSTKTPRSSRFGKKFSNFWKGHK